MLALNEAIHRWFGHQLPSDATIHGVPLFWLSRLGQLLQFVAAFVVIIDIIGLPRIQAFGRYAQAIDARRALVKLPHDLFQLWHAMTLRARLFLLPSRQYKEELVYFGHRAVSRPNPAYSYEHERQKAAKRTHLLDELDATRSALPFNHLLGICGHSLLRRGRLRCLSARQGSYCLRRRLGRCDHAVRHRDVGGFGRKRHLIPRRRFVARCCVSTLRCSS